MLSRYLSGNYRKHIYLKGWGGRVDRTNRHAYEFKNNREPIIIITRYEYDTGEI